MVISIVTINIRSFIVTQINVSIILMPTNTLFRSQNKAEYISLPLRKTYKDEEPEKTIEPGGMGNPIVGALLRTGAMEARAG